MAKKSMPLYEVELVREAGSELGLTDEALELGTVVALADSEWHVAAAARPYDPARRLRFICVETRRESKAPKRPKLTVPRRTRRPVRKPNDG